MLKALLIVLVALGPLTVTAQRRSRFPLIIDLVKGLTDGTPCMGPCILDNADYIMRQVELGDRSNVMKCARNFVNEVQGTAAYRNAPRDEAMKWMMVLGNPPVICPIVKGAIRCFAKELQQVCGLGLRRMVEKYWLDLTKFLDCGIPEKERLRTLECLVPPIRTPATIPKFDQFEQCIAPTVNNYLSNSWENNYRRGVANNFKGLCNALDTMAGCYLEFVRPATGTKPQCENAENEYRRQVKAVLKYINCYSDGTGVLRCLGDPSLYSDRGQALMPCIKDFGVRVDPVIKDIDNTFGSPNPRNIKLIIKALAKKTCKSLPWMVTCINNVFWSRPSCRQEIVPMVKAILAPSLQYIHRLGQCPPKDQKDISALKSCRCIVDYNVDRHVIGTCSAGPSFFVVTFVIGNKFYNDRTFLKLVADIKPTINKIFNEKFGFRFLSTSNYGGRYATGGLLVTFQVTLQASVVTTPRHLKDLIESSLDYKGYLTGTSGIFYRVVEGSISVSVLKPRPEGPQPLSTELIVLISVAGLVGFLLIFFVCICCCRACNSKSKRRPNKCVISPAPVKQCMPLGINYGARCNQPPSYPVCQPACQPACQCAVTSCSGSMHCNAPTRTIIALN